MKWIQTTDQEIAGTRSERLRLSAAEIQPKCLFYETDTYDTYLWIDNNWRQVAADRQPLTQTVIRDGVNLDAFSRLRVSHPEYVFDGQFTYNLLPLLYEPITANGGAIAHDATNRCADLTLNGTASGSAVMQTYEHFQYQPGRSQLIFCTFNMNAQTAGVTKFAGYSDGVNGVEFQATGTALQFMLRSTTGAGDETVTQANWNVDKLDGTGPSHLTLDITKAQIMVIDIQALYVGRVRVGFDIGGNVIVAHEFYHANLLTNPYVATANLPIRVGMTGGTAATMQFICCSVISEGGNSNQLGYGFAQAASVTAASGARTHMLSLQPKPTFNSITNRARLRFTDLDLLVTGNSPILWELCIGDVLTGTTTFNDVNATYSAMQYNTAGTTSGAPAIVVASGYVGATATVRGVTQFNVDNRYPITLDAAGAARTNGRLTLLVTGLGGTSACRATVSWKEVR